MGGGFIPVELISQRRWVSWKLVERNGKPSKVPFTNSGEKMAKSDNPQTWGYFDANGQNRGFMLLQSDYCVIDLDHCIKDGKLSDFAQKVVDKFKGTWMEYSPSGDGLHIWIRAKKPGKKSRNAEIEIYDGSIGRYLTVTGNTYQGEEILEMQEELDSLYAEMFPEKQAETPCNISYTGRATVDRVIEKILASRHADLFRGDMSAQGNDHSRADQALMNVIAFYCEGDRNLADMVFRSSALMRPKWNRDQYRNNTIDLAFRDLTDSYEWDANDIKVDLAAFKQQTEDLGYPKWVDLNYDGYTIGENVTDAKGHNICPHQIYISARVIDVDSKSEFVKLRFKRGNQWREEIIKASVIGDKTKIKALADMGLMVNDTNARFLVPFLSDFQIHHADRIPVEKATGKLGWHEGEFVPYSKCYTPNLPDSQIIPAMEPVGDYQKWIDCIKPEFEKHSEVRLAMGTAIASVLVQEFAINCFVTQLWGESGCGKTVTQMMAASIWGDPEKGFAISANGTDNALIQRCAALYNLPLVIDELETLRAGMRKIEFNGLIYTLTEGIERARLDSNAQSKDVRSWKNATLTNGEAPMTDNSNAQGALNRVIEINFPDAIFEKTAGNNIAKTVKNNYGWFGRMFVDYWREASAKWHIKFEQVTQFLLANAVTPKQAQAGAAVAVGAHIIADMLNIKCDAKQDILPHLKTMGDVNVAIKAKDYIMDVFTKHQSNFIESNSSGDDIIHRTQTWGKIDLETGEIFWVKEILEEELRNGNYSFNAVKKGWFLINFLKKGGDKYAVQTRIANGRPYCVRLMREKVETK